MRTGISDRLRVQILDGLAVIVNEVAGTPIDDITPEKSFVDDLDIDSRAGNGATGDVSLEAERHIYLTETDAQLLEARCGFRKGRGVRYRGALLPLWIPLLP